MSNEIKCPKCGTELSADEQRLVVTLKSESKYAPADLIGDVMRTQSRVLKAIASNLGEKVEVFIGSVQIADGDVTIEFLITAVRKA